MRIVSRQGAAWLWAMAFFVGPSASPVGVASGCERSTGEELDKIPRQHFLPSVWQKFPLSSKSRYSKVVIDYERLSHSGPLAGASDSCHRHHR